jgi:hypothetical protein
MPVPPITKALVYKYEVKEVKSAIRRSFSEVLIVTAV